MIGSFDVGDGSSSASMADHLQAAAILSDYGSSEEGGGRLPQRSANKSAVQLHVHSLITWSAAFRTRAGTAAVLAVWRQARELRGLANRARAGTLAPEARCRLFPLR